MKNSEDFVWNLKDRSSLFLPLALSNSGGASRTCASLNIESEGNCICNSEGMRNTIDNPFLIQKLIVFSLEELNSVINSSRQAKDKCRAWRLPISPHISAHQLSKNENNSTMDVLLKFKLFAMHPFEESFEVKLRVGWDSKGMEIEKLSTFSRISAYGEQSWCIQVDTRQDQLLKEYCFCKYKKPKKELN
jgi:hypothetical protein